MSNKKYLSRPLVVAIAALSVGALPASLQAADTSASVLEEVIVTAQRREQSIKDVPISITAFGEDIISQNNMKGATDYLAATPNVSFTEAQGEGPKGLKISIRGISDLQTDGERVSATSAFGIYVDEFNIGTAARGTPNPPLYDIERIEILRGPQGTFFGRNSTGGAINITTKKPTQNFFAQFDVGASSFNTYEVSGIVNVPVTDTFFVRAVLQNEASDGQVDNVSPLSDGGDSGWENTNVRVSARWDVSEQWGVDFSLNSARENNNMPNVVSAGIEGRFGSDLSSSVYTCGLEASSERKACRDTTGHTDFEDDTYNLRIGYTGEKFGFKSITGRTDSSMDQLNDLDQSGRAWVNRKNDYDAESISQEFRFFNLGSDTLEWTVGALVYKDELVAHNDILILDFLGPWMAGDSANQNTINMDRKGYAVFADVNWHISDALILTVGGRYSHDEEEQQWEDVYAGCPKRDVGDPLSEGCELRPDQVGAFTFLPVINGSVSGGRKAQTKGTRADNDGNDFSPRVALNWNVNKDWTIYGVASQGYKAAGARANPDSGGTNSSVYDKEKLTNFELGFKASLNGGRARIDAAVFSMTWDDFQTTIRETFCREEDGSLRPQDGNENCEFVPLDRIQNADEASAIGVELSMDVLVGKDLLFGLNYGYLKAKYENFDNAIANGKITDLSGYALPNAPENTASMFGTYHFRMGGADGYVRLEANYRDTVFNQDSIATPARAEHPFTPDDYLVVNLRAGLEWGTQRVTFGLYNLLGEDYAAGAAAGSAGVTVRPREPMFNIKWTAWIN